SFEWRPPVGRGVRATVWSVVPIPQAVATITGQRDQLAVVDVRVRTVRGAVAVQVFVVAVLLVGEVALVDRRGVRHEGVFLRPDQAPVDARGPRIVQPAVGGAGRGLVQLVDEPGAVLTAGHLPPLIRALGLASVHQALVRRACGGYVVDRHLGRAARLAFPGAQHGDAGDQAAHGVTDDVDLAALAGVVVVDVVREVAGDVLDRAVRAGLPVAHDVVAVGLVALVVADGADVCAVVAGILEVLQRLAPDQAVAVRRRILVVAVHQQQHVRRPGRPLFRRLCCDRHGHRDCQRGNGGQTTDTTDGHHETTPHCGRLTSDDPRGRLALV